MIRNKKKDAVKDNCLPSFFCPLEPIKNAEGNAKKGRERERAPSPNASAGVPLLRRAPPKKEMKK
jgi:hypothetical protein